MTLSEVRLFLGDDWTEVESSLRASLKSGIGLLDKVNEMVLSNSGKMLRPLICLLIARACSGGKANADSIRAAVSIELLHNATLMHDDVVDGSKERRGNPTLYAVLGGSPAVLVGDYWLTRAMGSVFEMTSHRDDIIRLFSSTLTRLAEGEMIQLEKAESGDTTEEDYLRIIYSKTASLFESSAASGAIASDASPEQIAAAKEYAICLGLAFQIRDDMFDYSSDSEIGKPVGIDLEEQKITLPLLGALANADEEVETEVRKRVVRIHENPELKDEIRDFVFSYGGMEYAAAKLQDYVSKAVKALEIFPESTEKEYLKSIAEYSARRSR